MIGVDEVGRGCWAGPLLVVAARANSVLPEGLTDSKLLTKKRRIELLNMLSNCCEFGEGWVKASEIDNFGLANALRLGISRALSALNALADETIILDGSVNYVDESFIRAKCVVKADLSEPTVSAASVYAKVLRDRFMESLGKQYPNYGFESHVGYGTSLHKDAIARFGVLKGVHRQSYKPIREIAETN
jgi:ribonuclease HII